jgi:FkbM family methyltransferase
MNHISSQGAILDIGANIGIMSYHLSKKFTDRKVFAIEPMPDNLAVLKKVIENYHLKNITILPIAVGNENTTLEMVLPVNGKVKMQGLAHVVHDTIEEWNDGEKFNVKSCKLDDQFPDTKIAGIKMDIENFEYFALLGSEKIIKSNLPVIYLELWSNENRDKCFDFLLGLGYTANVVAKDQLVNYNPDEHHKQNFIFIAQNQD